MQVEIDPRLNDIDDCLYRVAVRAFIIRDDAVLLVKEADADWWAFPGGGVDHGETVETALLRELEEELGVPAAAVSSDFQIAHYSIGNIVSAVPRMNLYFRVSVPEAAMQKTSHIETWRWLSENEFLKLRMHPSYDKAALASAIWQAPPAGL